MESKIILICVLIFIIGLLIGFNIGVGTTAHYFFVTAQKIGVINFTITDEQFMEAFNKYRGRV